MTPSQFLLTVGDYANKRIRIITHDATYDLTVLEAKTSLSSKGQTLGTLFASDRDSITLPIVSISRIELVGE